MLAYFLLKLSGLILSASILAACGSTVDRTPAPAITGSAAPTASVQPTPVSTPTGAGAPSPTPPASTLVLIKPAESGLGQTNQIETTLSGLAEDQGFHFQVRQTLDQTDLNGGISHVVALPPDPGLSSLAAAAPEIQFLGVGIPGLEPDRNLTVISPQGASPQEIGFLAGYIAAVVSSEWRVGAISASDTTAGTAARNGFLNGVVYFCGLCRQTHPPYYDYPLYVELPSASTPTEWQTAADTLRDRMVKTVYVAPEAGDQSLLEYLARSGINIIASGTPPEAIKDHWVASIQVDYLPALKEVWPEWINGSEGTEFLATVEIDQINQALFSPGRQMLVEALLIDLQNGYIDTSPNPSTTDAP